MQGVVGGRPERKDEAEERKRGKVTQERLRIHNQPFTQPTILLVSLRPPIARFETRQASLVLLIRLLALRLIRVRRPSRTPRAREGGDYRYGPYGRRRTRLCERCLEKHIRVLGAIESETMWCYHSIESWTRQTAMFGRRERRTVYVSVVWASKMNIPD